MEAGANKKSPLISIIVPIYNIEDYIEECVKSLSRQTYENIEVLLVDDGSTDKSSGIIQELAIRDKRLRVLRKENGGLPHARNYGLSHAKGAFLCFVDGDDWVEDTYVSDMYHASNESGADIVVSGFYKSYPDGRNINHSRRTNGHQVFSNLEAVKDVMRGDSTLKHNAWGKLYRAELFGKNAIAYPVGKTIGEDQLTTYKLLFFANKVTYIDKPLYHYRQIEGSMMSYTKLRDVGYLFNVTDEMRDFFSLHDTNLDYFISNAKALNYNSFANMAILRSKLTTGLWRKIINETKKERLLFIRNRRNGAKQRIGILMMSFGRVIYTLFYRIKERMGVWV